MDEKREVNRRIDQTVMRWLPYARSGTGVFVTLWVSFFLSCMALGFWMPALTNILKAQGLGQWVPVIFMILPICALISPLMGGALADQRISAERLLGWTSLIGSLLLFAAFWFLQHGFHPLWFVIFLGLYSLVSGPSMSLLTTISMTHLRHGEYQFPWVRVGGTLGWIAGGLVTSYVMRADSSPTAGYGGAIARCFIGLLAFVLPMTPPLGVGLSWRSRLGLDAFSLFKHRDTCVFFLVTVWFSIPLAAFYMYAPELLSVLGSKRPTGLMTTAQALEVVSMLGIGWVISRVSVKKILLLSLGFSVLRFGMSAYAGCVGSMGWHIAGIALHGACYTFYFITAQVVLARSVDPGMKSQAQGMLAMLAGGLGPLVGAWFCGWLHQVYVKPDGTGWAEFWSMLSAMIAVSTFVLWFYYRGEAHQKSVRTHP